MSQPRGGRGRPVLAGACFCATTLAVASAASCSIANGLVLPPKGVDASAVDQSVSETSSPAPDADDGCEHARVPKPTPGAPDGPENLDLLFAFRSVDFGSGKVGLDLDNVCTCTNGAQGSCKVTSSAPACDENGGRDNALGRILSTIKGTAHYDIEERINELIDRGKSGLLVRVQGWNGQPDDSLVQVSFYPSRGVCTPPAIAADAGDAGDAGDASDAGDSGDAAEAGDADPFYDPTLPRCVPPTFDASDEWAYDPTQLLGDPSRVISKLTATNAYVTNGMLVAEVAGRMPLATLDLILQAGVVMGRIGANPPSLSGGIIAGRWKLEDAFQALRRLSVGDAGLPLCQSPAYQIGESTICSLADIMALPSDDDSGVACNAISVGVAFEAAPASFGPPIIIDTVGGDCPNAGLPCR